MLFIFAGFRNQIESSAVPIKKSSKEMKIMSYELFEQEKLQSFDAICECVE